MALLHRKEFLAAVLMLWTFAMTLVQAHEALQGHCPKRCRCTNWDGDMMVDCSNLRLTSIPHLPHQVKYLYFSGNNLTQITPAEGFTQYPSLIELYLNDNQISYIHRSGLPKTLETLHLEDNRLSHVVKKMFHRRASLVVLNLNRNRILYVEDGSLPFTLENLQLSGNNLTRVTAKMVSLIPPLRAIYLNNNKIRKIEDGAFPPNVTLINLGNNLLSVVKNQFTDVPQLRILNLYSNHIRRLGPKAFANMPLLKELSLLGNRLTDIPGEQFAMLENMTTLNLYANSIATFDRTALPENGLLKRLYLQKNPLVCDCHLRWLPDRLVTDDLNSDMFDFFFKDSSVAEEDWPFDYPDERDIRCALPMNMRRRRVSDRHVPFDCATSAPTVIVERTVQISTTVAAAASSVFRTIAMLTDPASLFPSSLGQELDKDYEEILPESYEPTKPAIANTTRPEYEPTKPAIARPDAEYEARINESPGLQGDKDGRRLATLQRAGGTGSASVSSVSVALVMTGLVAVWSVQLYI